MAPDRPLDHTKRYEVQIGQTVAFAARRGNSAELRTGVVTAITPEGWVTILSDRNHDCQRACYELAVLA